MRFWIVFINLILINWKLNINSAFQNFERSWQGTERIQPIQNGNWNRPLGKYKITEQKTTLNRTEKTKNHTL